jgi:hypothetical protein
VEDGAVKTRELLKVVKGMLPALTTPQVGFSLFPFDGSIGAVER